LLLLAFILPNILNGYHRFISLESSRFSTQSNVLEIIKNDPDKIIIGYGLSNFFPYNKWYAGQKSNRKNENIYYDDDVNAKILVEPHSLYIWLLAETGLVGLFLFGGYYYTNFMKKAIIIIKTPDNYEPIIVAWALAIVSISIASFSGSFIINEPQIALVCWFISISFSKYIAISQNRSLTNKYLLSVKNISIKK
jgi:O-antigen ligase